MGRPSLVRLPHLGHKTPPWKAEKNWLQKIAIVTFGRFIIRKYKFNENFFLPLALKVREAVKMPLVYVGGVMSSSGIDEIMKEKFEARDPKSMALKITAYSHGGETQYEPVNNIARITLAALAYVLGGVQFLYNASYDEVMGTPTENAAKISLRIQQILAHWQ